MRRNKSVGNILAFLNPYVGTGFAYIIIRGLMGMRLNTIGKIYFVASSAAMIVATIAIFTYLIKTQHKKFTYRIDQVLYIILAIAATCLLIELFMFEEYVYDYATVPFG